MSSPLDMKTVGCPDNEEFPSKNASEISIEQLQVPKVPTQYADESYKLFSQIGEIDDPTPEEARKIRNKCIRRILPFICVGYHVMYVDKQTVSGWYFESWRFLFLQVAAW